MPVQIRHPEWRDSHDDSRFPFADTATLTNVAGDQLFPEIFLDAALYPIGGQSRSYLSQVQVTSRRITLVIGDAAQPVRASASFDPEDPPSELAVTDTAGRPAGILVSEPLRLATFRSWSVGTHEFAIGDTEFAAGVCFPTPESGVRGIELDDGSVLTNDVWLVGDDGIVLTCETAPTQEGCAAPSAEQHTIRVHAVGDPLFRRRLCPSPDYFQAPQFLRELCFVSPGRQGQVGSAPSETGAADIFFLTDSSGSMSDFLSRVQAIFPQVINTVLARFPNSTFRWGAADYRDFGDGGTYDTLGVNIGALLHEDPNKAYTAVQNWRASGGGNIPEQNLVALQYLAEHWEALGGRTGVPRAIIWSGDAVGWEQGTQPGAYVSLSSTIAALQGANLLVYGVNLLPSRQGIDDICPGPSSGLQQASTIIAATGGALTNDVLDASAAVVAELLIEAISRTEGGTPGEEPLPAQRFCCGPGDYGDIKITVGSQDAEDTILRVRPTPAGLIIEAVGERLQGGIR